MAHFSAFDDSTASRFIRVLCKDTILTYRRGKSLKDILVKAKL